MPFFLGSALYWDAGAGQWVMQVYQELEPLWEPLEVRGFFTVPREVVENEAAPLRLLVTLPSDDAPGGETEFTFQIR